MAHNIVTRSSRVASRDWKQQSRRAWHDAPELPAVMPDADLLINSPRASQAADGRTCVFVVVSGLLALLLSGLEVILHSTLLRLQVGSARPVTSPGTWTVSNRPYMHPIKLNVILGTHICKRRRASSHALFRSKLSQRWEGGWGPPVPHPSPHAASSNGRTGGCRSCGSPLTASVEFCH